MAAYKLFTDEGLLVTPGTAPQSGLLTETVALAPAMGLADWTDESIVSEAS